MLEGERKISTLEGAMMLVIALIIYIVFFPVTIVGFGIIPDIICTVLYAIWINLIHGISMQRPSSILTPIVDMVPELNIIPFWFAYIIWIVVTAREKPGDEEGSEGGADMQNQLPSEAYAS